MPVHVRNWALLLLLLVQEWVGNFFEWSFMHRATTISENSKNPTRYANTRSFRTRCDSMSVPTRSYELLLRYREIAASKYEVYAPDSGKFSFTQNSSKSERDLCALKTIRLEKSSTISIDRICFRSFFIFHLIDRSPRTSSPLVVSRQKRQNYKPELARPRLPCFSAIAVRSPFFPHYFKFDHSLNGFENKQHRPCAITV